MGRWGGVRKTRNSRSRAEEVIKVNKEKQRPVSSLNIEHITQVKLLKHFH